MTELSDRVILTTIDKKVIVRPEMDLHNCTFENLGVTYCLDEDGIHAWNTGEEIEPYHILFFHPAHLPENIIF